MNYDNWKLQAPEYNDDVTSCCGAQEYVKENLADDSKIYYCSECGDDNYTYEIICETEYNERRREDALEHNRDEE
jgi:hypothetical protein